MKTASFDLNKAKYGRLIVFVFDQIGLFKLSDWLKNADC